MTKFSLLLASMAVTVGTTVGSYAEDAAGRGAAIVEEWCRVCHLRASPSPDPDMAPAFEDIVRRGGRNKAYFARFMQEDHFPMTTFRLFDHEKADVVAYLLALQHDGGSN